MTLGELERAFAEAGLVRGQQLYLPVDGALAYLEACKSRRLAILGLEAFSFVEGGVKPHLDLIADFSELVERDDTWDEVVAASVSAAREFLLREVGRDSGFSVTIVAMEAE